MAWKPTRKLKADLARYFKLRGQGKGKYILADDLLTVIMPRMPAGSRVELPDGRQIEMVDNFAGRNTAYRPSGVSRFELKDVTGKRPESASKT